jgi:hypothetical protein
VGYDGKGADGIGILEDEEKDAGGEVEEERERSGVLTRRLRDSGGEDGEDWEEVLLEGVKQPWVGGFF